MRKIYSLLLVVTALMAVNYANAQYCSPRFGDCWGYTSSITTTGAIQNINLQGLSANSSGPNYNNRTADVLKLGPGTATMTVNMSTCFSSSFWTGGRLYLWADWNGNNQFDNPQELIAQDLTTAPFPQTKTLMIPAPVNPGVNTTRMRLMINQSNPCYSGFGDGNCVDFTVEYSVPFSAAPGKLVSPGNPACNSSSDLTITVRNTGQNDIDTVTVGGNIYYEVSGTRLKQPIPDTTYIVHIKSGTESSPLQLYSFSNGFSPDDSIELFTSFPHGMPDDNVADDTLIHHLNAVIPGNFYTIGDTANGNPNNNDFSSFRDAIDFLNSFGAICDSLIFEMEDDSSLSTRGQFEINEVLGSSYDHYITFRPKASNTAGITILNDSCYSGHDYVLQLNNVSHINFEGIRFVSTNVINGTGYYSAVSLEDGTHHVTFDGCTFATDQVQNTSWRVRKRLVYTDSDVGDYIMFDECLFLYGSDAIDLAEGDSLMIFDCGFQDQYWMGAHVEDYGAVAIEDSWFKSVSTYASGTNALASVGSAIYLHSVHGELQLNNNVVMSSNGQWPRYGISLDDYNAIGQTCQISNNMINVGQPWSSLRYRPFSVNNSVGVEAYHNSFVATGNSNDNAGVHVEGGANHEFYNNIFATMLTGKAIVTSTAAAILNSDNNNYYVKPGGDLASFNGTNITTLADWQLTTSMDANALNVNPDFYNVPQNDLHVCNDSLFKTGTPISSVMYDIDGDMRDASNPCIGADEFAPVEFFSLGDDYGLCPGDSTILQAGNGNFGEIAIWKDASGTIIDTAQFLTVHTPGLYEVTLLNACGILVDSIDIIDPDFVVLGNDTNMCPNTMVSYDAAITDGYTYEWSNGDTTAMITVTEEDKYIVTVTDVWGCVTMDSADVTYSNAADLNEKSAIICEGVALQLFGGTPDGPDVSYKWDGFLGANLEIGDNVFVDYIQVNDTDTVVVELTHRGCVTSDTTFITRDTKPDASMVTWSTNGLAFNVTGNTTTGNSHLWVFGDSSTSTFPEPRHLYGSSGTYTVIYYSTNDCGTDSSIHEITVIFLNVAENGEESIFSLYPNPNRGQFQVNFSNVDASEVDMVITDVQGKIVANRSLGAIHGSMNEDFELNLGSGVYFVKVTLDGSVHNAKFTVE